MSKCPLRAKRTGLLSTVRPPLDAVVAQGFHLGSDLYEDILSLAGEA